MRRIVLLGSPDTKRTIYLKKAAEEEGISIELLNWQDWNGQLPEGKLFLKIDPPVWNSCLLERLEALTGEYGRQLVGVEQAAADRNVEFFNPPSAIMELLNKHRCKERLSRAGLPVTEQLCSETRETEASLSDASIYPVSTGIRSAGIRNTGQLLEHMQQKKVCQVFIKPALGSGAAGVSAFRIQPATGRMSLYTCACETSGAGLVNTKKLRQYMNPKEIRTFLDRLLALDCIVERWYPKAVHDGCTYDLRVVVQERQIDYILARMSKGPITNLHLNNHPLSLKELHLPLWTLEKTEVLCRAAMDCFPGLRSAGIDILLEKGSLEPRIIEMNAQGDLIYQDIYHENIIYRRQAKRMKAWLFLTDFSTGDYR